MSDHFFQFDGSERRATSSSCNEQHLSPELGGEHALVSPIYIAIYSYTHICSMKYTHTKEDTHTHTNTCTTHDLTFKDGEGGKETRESCCASKNGCQALWPPDAEPPAWIYRCTSTIRGSPTNREICTAIREALQLEKDYLFVYFFSGININKQIECIFLKLNTLIPCKGKRRTYFFAFVARSWWSLKAFCCTSLS